MRLLELHAGHNKKMEQSNSAPTEQLPTRKSPSPNVSITARAPSPASKPTQSSSVSKDPQTLLPPQQQQHQLFPSSSQQLTQFVKRSPSPAVGLLHSAGSGRSPSPSVGASSFASPSSNVAHLASSGTSDGPPPPKRKRLFHRELKYMMHGFGDDPTPYSETVDLVEELVVQFITEMTVKAMEVGKSGRVHVNDIIFIIRKDPKKYARVKDLLMMKEQIDKAKKAFSDDSEPLEII